MLLKTFKYLLQILIRELKVTQMMMLLFCKVLNDWTVSVSWNKVEVYIMLTAWNIRLEHGNCSLPGDSPTQEDLDASYSSPSLFDHGEKVPGTGIGKQWSFLSLIIIVLNTDAPKIAVSQSVLRNYQTCTGNDSSPLQIGETNFQQTSEKPSVGTSEGEDDSSGRFYGLKSICHEFSRIFTYSLYR